MAPVYAARQLRLLPLDSGTGALRVDEIGPISRYDLVLGSRLRIDSIVYMLGFTLSVTQPIGVEEGEL
jgi:hypothetical protein